MMSAVVTSEIMTCLPKQRSPDLRNEKERGKKGNGKGGRNGISAERGVGAVGCFGSVATFGSHALRGLTVVCSEKFVSMFVHAWTSQVKSSKKEDVTDDVRLYFPN